MHACFYPVLVSMQDVVRCLSWVRDFPRLAPSHHFIPQGHAAKPWWDRAQRKLERSWKKVEKKKGAYWLGGWFLENHILVKVLGWLTHKTFTCFSSIWFCRLFNWHLLTDTEFCIEPQYGLVFIALQSVIVQDNSNSDRLISFAIISERWTCCMELYSQEKTCLQFLLSGS